MGTILKGLLDRLVLALAHHCYGQYNERNVVYIFYKNSKLPDAQQYMQLSMYALFKDFRRLTIHKHLPVFELKRFSFVLLADATCTNADVGKTKICVHDVSCGVLS